MRRYTHAALLASLIAAAPAPLLAQGNELYGQGYRFNLDERGDKYIRFITWHQVWTRFTELNPGTTIQGQPERFATDIGLRRSRFLAFSQLGESVLILMHVGINNQTFNNQRKPQVFIHDAWVEYQVAKDLLYTGFGLHYWNGISRISSASTLNFLGLDAPIMNWPTIDRTDQFARMMGMYAKGKLGPLDYRLALNRPFSVDGDVAPGAPANYNPQANTWAGQGYLALELLDRESNKLPFTVGSYLGSKRVLNVGAGFLFHPQAMATRSEDGQLVPHDMLAVAADVFLDLPLGEDAGALTAYTSASRYDFGPNHLRSIGIMNIGADGSSANGPGNALPLIGTGNHLHAQLGYLLPEVVFGGAQVQPYASLLLSAFDALKDPALTIDAGVNWFLIGHHAKLTLNYRSRPIFDRETTEVTSRASEVILQTMIYL